MNKCISVTICILSDCFPNANANKTVISPTSCLLCILKKTPVQFDTYIIHV